ncbi:carboxypeptidase-like regulatory domain-containing protein [Pontibacter korlensis]|uniref:TonB-dependent receptor n=1 Tax=Pontibacter korlensis TaxID=400092 RepID=A0A0E3ZE83_9BACT|nr:hypothetical protein PKOR_10740 [Pontibacter korlensis]
MGSHNDDSLSYVNIGIWNKNIGTASDEHGVFKLALSQEHALDTLTFSAIGYKELSIAVQDINKSEELEIKLVEKVANLQEVAVTGRKMKIKKLGITGRLPVVWGNPDRREELNIYEFANLIEIKEKPTQLLSAHFYLTSSKMDSALFRINLYKERNGMPGERLAEQSIVQRLSTKEGWVRIDLKPFGVYTEEDFYLGIEYLPAADAERKSIMLGGKLGGSSYSRKASLCSWEKFVGASLSGYVTVLQ